MSTQRETAGHTATIVTILIWGRPLFRQRCRWLILRQWKYYFTGFDGLYCSYSRTSQNDSIQNWRHELLFAGAGLFGVTLYFLLENIALTYTYASNVGMIVSIIPMITAVLAHFLLEGEKLRLTFSLDLGRTDRAFIDYVQRQCRTASESVRRHHGSRCRSRVWRLLDFYEKLSAYDYHIIELTQSVFLRFVVYGSRFIFVRLPF